MTTEVSGYPVSYEVLRPDHQSRITNFPLGIGMIIRAVLAIPHLLILYALGIVAYVLVFIAQFAILFTGKFPEGMFNMVVGVQRWGANVYGYMMSLYDDYPPFSTSTQAGYPLTLEVDYPSSSSRILNFPLGIGMIIRIVLLLPNLIVFCLFFIPLYLIILIAPFAILFTGSYPSGMHSFAVGVMRWGQRLSAYCYGLTDKYPPFGTK